MPHKKPYEIDDTLLGKYKDSTTTLKTFGIPNLANAYDSKHPNAKAFLDTTHMPGAGDKSPSLATYLRSAPNQNAVRMVETCLQNYFSPVQATETAFHTFQENFQALEASIKAGKFNLRVETLPELVRVMHADLRSAIEAQQNKELGAMKNDSPTFAAQFQTAFGVDLPTATGIVQECIKKLEATHKKLLEDFDKSAKEAVEKIQLQVQADFRRINALNALYMHQADLKKEIDKLYELELQKQGKQPVVAQQGQAHVSDLYKGIKLNSLSNLTTVTGTGITRDGVSLTLTYKPLVDSAKSGLYTFRGNGDKKADDLLSLAYMMRANGVDKITMTVSGCSKHADSLKLAQQSYEACILAGYKPEDITIIGMDHEEKKMDDVLVSPKIKADAKLFQNFPERLRLIHEKGDAIQKAEQRATERHITANEARKALETLRNSAANPPPAISSAQHPGL